MSRKTPVEFSTRYYERSHGRKPKGRGHWMFELVDESCGATVSVVSVPGSLSLADARTWMRTHVRTEYAEELATGFLVVEVAP